MSSYRYHIYTEEKPDTVIDSGRSLPDGLPEVGQVLRLTVEGEQRHRITRVVDRTNDRGNGGTPRCNIWVRRLGT